MTLIRSPLSQIGRKHALLARLVPLFPKGINAMIDLFCGSCDVSFNIRATRKIANDSDSRVIGIRKEIPAVIESRKTWNHEDPDCELYAPGPNSRPLSGNAMLEQDKEGLLVKSDATFIVIENPKNGKRAVISPVRVITVSYCHRDDEVAAKALENYADCASLVTGMPVSGIMGLQPQIDGTTFSLFPDRESEKPVIQLSVRGINMRELLGIGLKEAQEEGMQSAASEKAEKKGHSFGPKLSS